MSETENVTPMEDIDFDIDDVMNEAAGEVAEQSNLTSGRRFYFTKAEGAHGQPRLTRFSVREQVGGRSSGNERPMLMATAEYTIDGFRTNDEFHVLERYAKVRKHQVARLRTQQWIEPATSIEALEQFKDFMVVEKGWNLYDEPRNLSELRSTEDLFRLSPSDPYNEENPQSYGVTADLEISGERDENRYDRNFDGDFVAVAEQHRIMAEDVFATKDPELRREKARALVRAMARITGDRHDDKGQVWAKNCSSGVIVIDGQKFQFYGVTPGDTAAESKALNKFRERVLTGAGGPARQATPTPDAPEFEGAQPPDSFDQVINEA